MKKNLFLLILPVLLHAQQPRLPYPVIFIHGLTSNARIWMTGNNNLRDYFINNGLTSGGTIDIALDYDRTGLVNSKDDDVHPFTAKPDSGDFYFLNFAVHATGYTNSKDSEYPYEPLEYPNPEMVTEDDEELILSFDPDDNLKLQNGKFFPGDLVRIDDEWLRVKEVSDNSVTLERHLFDTLPVTHGKGTLIWNISNESNQSAIAKQGWAVKLAIDAVKDVTKSSKVILVGHSMGGLAAREYMQSSYYQNDVAKLVTIGTPHLGANSDEVNKTWTINRLLDYRSDAMRDLRYNYVKKKDSRGPEAPYGDFPDNAVFLFGGFESESLEGYYSGDFNADGKIDMRRIRGLSEEISYLPDDAEYCWIVSDVAGALGFGKHGDGAVRADRQYPQDKNGTMGEIINIGVDHGSEPQDQISLLRGMDEPDNKEFSYAVELDINYLGFMTRDGNWNNKDNDYYSFYVNSGGLLTVKLDGAKSGVKETGIIDESGNTVVSDVVSGFPFTLSADLKPGKYYLKVAGESDYIIGLKPHGKYDYDNIYNFILNLKEKTVENGRILSIIVLDNSASMDERAQGSQQTKFQEACSAFTKLITEAPGRCDFSLVVFNARSSAAEIVSPTSDRNKLISAMKSLRTDFNTPLGRALEIALQSYLDNKTYSKTAIIVLSDGLNNCPPDPLVVAARIKQYTSLQEKRFSLGNILHNDLYAQTSNRELLFFIIGFATSAAENAVFYELAKTAGGEFYTAANLPQLQENLKQIIDNLNSGSGSLTIIMIIVLIIVLSAGVSFALFGRKGKVPAVMITSVHPGRMRVFRKDSISFGKMKTCDVAVDDRTVSSRHSLLKYDKVNRVFYIMDLNSMNGTYLNGEKIYRAAINPGDKITLGRMSFLINYDSSGNRPARLTYNANKRGRVKSRSSVP